MQLRNSPSRYGIVAIALHWFTAGCVIVAWLLGTFHDELPRGTVRSAGLLIHMWAGLAVMALLVLRVPWSFFDRPLPHEVTPLGAWVGHAATLTHLALYALLVATLVVGIVLQFSLGRPLPLFGIAEIASPWVRDRAYAIAVKDIHETLANVLMVVAAIHAAAALAHHWILRDRTLARMLPFLGR
jgi:cytochrome b561